MPELTQDQAMRVVKLTAQFKRAVERQREILAVLSSERGRAIIANIIREDRA